MQNLWICRCVPLDRLLRESDRLVQERGALRFGGALSQDVLELKTGWGCAQILDDEPIKA